VSCLVVYESCCRPWGWLVRVVLSGKERGGGGTSAIGRKKDRIWLRLPVDRGGIWGGSYAYYIILRFPGVGFECFLAWLSGK
jgi:hypothetical protein